jgi:hypothetical protein
MSDLNTIEKLKLEKMFDMGTGYVLNFSNRTFSNFITETIGIDIYNDKYSDNGDSKANRLRTFWQKENNYYVGKLALTMLDYWKEQKIMSYNQISQSEELLFKECNNITQRLLQNVPVEEIGVIRDNVEDPNFDRLAKSIRSSIEKNEPETALDRLHTYTMRYIRVLCEKHGVTITKEESLNAIFGKYVKHIFVNEKIESQMTLKILKYSINVIEAFNDVRNNKSLAHDNPILNYAESLLIFNNITNTIKFIEKIEEQINITKNPKKEATEEPDSYPF